MAENLTPFQLVKPRPKKKSGDGGPPKNPPAPKWLAPLAFPEESSALLKKARISKRQFSRYAEQVLLFLVTHGSADYAASLLRQVRYGDRDGMKTFGQILGLIKNESAVTVNLHQNNLSLEAPGMNKDFDSMVRALDERERKAALDLAAPLRLLPEAIDAEFEDAQPLA